jgi:hypothetical protein
MTTLFSLLLSAFLMTFGLAGSTANALCCCGEACACVVCTCDGTCTAETCHCTGCDGTCCDCGPAK